MDINVGLVIFAANSENLMNSYVLMHRRSDGLLEIPAGPLEEDHDSLTTAKDIVYRSSGVTGNWMEMNPRQSGIFDDVFRNPHRREILLCYTLFLPAKFTAKPGYVWITVDSLYLQKLYLDAESLIRYAILGGPL